MGLALSDASRTLASPLTVITVSAGLNNSVELISREIDRLEQEEDSLFSIVVGLPSSLDGKPNVQTEKVMTFIGELRLRTSLPVIMQDERLSSREAEQRLAIREKDWRRRKARLDAAAAAVILQDYLDEHSRNETQQIKPRSE
jgi:putative Holliday junction resolvase